MSAADNMLHTTHSGAKDIGMLRYEVASQVKVSVAIQWA